MRHFLTTADWTREELENLLDDARRLRAEPIQDRLRGRTIALVFFNPSLRTRASFDVGAHQLGAHAVILEPGRGAWPIEFVDGVVMDGEAEEHVCEAARVLSRYCDLIAVRAFPSFADWSVDRQDIALLQFARHATVPVINMETIVHPCQELALMMALQDRLGEPGGRNFLLTWTYHPRPLNTAVANSAVLIASKFGMNVTLLCPDEQYHLDARYTDLATAYAAEQGGSFRTVYDIESAYRGADIVYAKSWGAIPFYGNWEAERPVRDQYKHFIVDAAKMALTPDALFSHCLPVRRNVKVSDEVIDSDRSLVIEEAGNRLHVQKAIMSRLVNS